MARTHRIGTAFFAALAVARGASAVAAPDAAQAFHCPSPGTTILTTAGVTVALRDGAPMHCIAKVNGVERDTILQTIAGDDKHAGELRDEMGKIWPLVVGTSRLFYVGLPDDPIVNHVSVTARAAIDLPAGRFDTDVIEWTHFGVNCGAILDEVDRYFYSPSLGAVVKYEHEVGYGDASVRQRTAHWEALKIVPPGDESVAAMSRRPLNRPPSAVAE